MAQAKRLKEAFHLFYNQGGAVGWLFIVLETLHLKASEFFEVFAEWLEGSELLRGNSQATSFFAENPQHGDALDLQRQKIIAQQLMFVKQLFEKYGFSHFWPVVDNIIQLHGAMLRSLYLGGPESHNENTSLISVHKASLLLKLKYLPDDLFMVGDYNLEEFLQLFEPSKTHTLVYNRFGSVEIMALDNLQYEFVSLLTGKTSEYQPGDELTDYLLSEGILHAI